MNLLVHTCCADCALKMQQALNKDKSAKFSKIGWYFYNPNIHPKTEYLARLKALKTTANKQQLDLIIPNYRPVEYFDKIKHLGSHPLIPDRCRLCWSLRLEKSFEYAKDHEFKAVGTTLITSHYQDQAVIEKIGKRLAEQYQIQFYTPEEIDKDLKTSGFYKQNYCGCTYSLMEKMEQKFLRDKE